MIMKHVGVSIASEGSGFFQIMRHAWSVMQLQCREGVGDGEAGARNVTKTCRVIDWHFHVSGSGRGRAAWPKYHRRCLDYFAFSSSWRGRCMSHE